MRRFIITSQPEIMAAWTQVVAMKVKRRDVIMDIFGNSINKMAKRLNIE